MKSKSPSYELLVSFCKYVCAINIFVCLRNFYIIVHCILHANRLQKKKTIWDQFSEATADSDLRTMFQCVVYAWSYQSRGMGEIQNKKRIWENIMFKVIGDSNTLCWLTSEQSFPTLQSCSPQGSSVRGIFPSKNTAVGCHFLLQGIFPTQGSIKHMSLASAALASRFITIGATFRGGQKSLMIK